MSESVILATAEPAQEAAPSLVPDAAAVIPVTNPASIATIVQPTPVISTMPHAEAIDLLLAQWAVEFLHDSPVSRATEAMNHFTTIALPALRQRLLSEV